MSEDLNQDKTSEAYRKKLYSKCVRKFESYSSRCAEMEECLDMLPYTYQNRIPVNMMAEKTKDWTVEELEAFLRRLKLADYRLRDDEFEQMLFVYIANDFGRLWRGMKKRWRRVKTVVSHRFGKLKTKLQFM